MNRLPLLTAPLALATLCSSTLADETARSVKLTSPVPFQVVQRERFVAARAYENAPGGPALGEALVSIRGDFPKVDQAQAEYRAVPLPGAIGAGTPWQPLAHLPGPEREAIARVPAGGWYRLEVRVRSGESTVAEAVVEPVGAGEVFLVAGQSYAAGANDELLKVDDPQGRVVAFDPARKVWQVAHDPQPGVGDGGTIWPPLGNTLVPLARVPVAFVNVAVGGTASRQWLPGEVLYQKMVETGQSIGRFRAVLWQQGESDVIEKTPTAKYVENLVRIRGESAKAWGFEPPWLLAKSTLHPTVYSDPQGELRIRTAIDQLVSLQGFRAGPDTDILAGENRGGPQSRRHFSGVGQRRAAQLWFASIWNELQAGSGAFEMPPLSIEQTESGERFGIWGSKPPRPAPTLFILAAGMEDTARQPIYFEVGRLLTREGYICVTLDPPCHGADARPGEPAGLQGWAARLEKGEDPIASFNARARAVLDHLVKTGVTDPAHVAACGTSRGGFLAYHFAAVEPRVRAVAGFSPVTNLLALAEFANLKQHEPTKQLGLVHHATKLADRAIWLSIGNNDARVDTDDAITFARKTSAAAIAAANPRGSAAPIELLVGSSVGHTIIADAHRLAAEWISRRLNDEG
jgi:dienelactone hydrolase